MHIRHYGHMLELRLKRYAHLFFTLPSTRKLLVLVALLLTLELALGRWVYLTWYAIASVELLVLWRLGFLNLASERRLLGSLLALLLFSSPYLLLGCPECLTLESIVIYILLEALSSETNRYKLYFFAALPSLLFFAIGMSENFLRPSKALMGLILDLGFYLLIEYVIRKVEKVSRYPAYTNLKLLLYYFLTGNPRPLEVFFYGLSEKKDVKILVAKFYDKESRASGALVLPGFHFGPFDHIGSSEFAEKIISEFSSRNIPAMVLHGAGSHELDIASSIYVSRLIEKILGIYSLANRPNYIKFRGPVELRSGDVSCLAIELSEIRLFFVQRLAKTTDDIPSELSELLGLQPREYLVECQNGYNPRFPGTWDEKSFENLRSCIENARTLLQSSKARYARVNLWHVPHYLLPKEFKREVNSGGISVLEILDPENSEIILAIVAVDANNIVLDRRLEFERHLRALLGYSRVIVASTDSHSKTDLCSSGFYNPLFSESSPLRLAELLHEFKVERSETIKEARYVEWLELVELVPLLSESYYKLVRALDTSARLGVIILAYLAVVGVVLLV